MSSVWVTVRLATVSTVILLCLGLPLGWWLSQTKFRGKILVEALIALPLVLPPTVLGFYLLIAFGGDGPFAKVGLPLAFTFWGLVAGSVVYSLPFVVQPIQNAFSFINREELEAAATLGASPWDRFLSIVIPKGLSGVVTAAALGFAHTVGEFGVVLMIGGNIPDKTRVVSIALYDHVEALEYSQAHLLAGGLLIFSFVLLSFVYLINRRFRVGTL